MKYDTLPVWLRHIWLAAVLLTRLPLPRLPEAAFKNGAQAVWSYPLAGVLVAAISGSVGVALMALGLPAPLAAGAVLVVAFFVTGAMHEDGLADVADGFWGGYTPDRRLAIMRDSQIGTYGVLALAVSTALRWGALAYLLPTGMLPWIVAAACSRAVMPWLMYTLPRARSDGLSHSVGQPGRAAVVTGSALAFGLAVFFLGWAGLVVVLIVTMITIGMGYLAKIKIGGQTGDVLGCTQVVAETTALLACVMLLAS
ncbi:MAG: adenosylcobinamide-GDP ribazoletransferase [Roseobacter sp.]